MIKRQLFHFSFILPLLAFIVHQVLQKVYNINFQWIDSYLDPFCFTSLLFPLLLTERNLIFKQRKFSIIEVVVICMIMGVISEIAFPYFFPQRFTQDFLDILFISLGGIWFLAFHPSNH